MVEAKYEVIQRGYDSSGRPLRNTKMHWQHFDRVNADAADGNLVMVQSGFRYSDGADASANTHRLAGCSDWRRWNLSDLVAGRVQYRSRELMGSAFERTQAQGFDPHFHNVLLGDYPMDPEAYDQGRDWIAGGNGIGGADVGVWRPAKFHDYIYLPEDDMFEDADRALLAQIDRKLDAERTRDQKERDKDKERFQRLIHQKGELVDSLTLAINKAEGDLKGELQAMKRRLLKELKDDPDVTGVDNPSDDVMAREV